MRLKFLKALLLLFKIKKNFTESFIAIVLENYGQIFSLKERD